jgi:NADH:ubiquinone oxidoreductase subunit K
MIWTNPTTIVLVSILGLLGIGLYCLLATRNLIKVIIALQIMIKGVVLAFLLAGSLGGNGNQAQTFALTIIVADTIVAVVGLALSVKIRQVVGSLDIKDISSLKR